MSKNLVTIFALVVALSLTVIVYYVKTKDLDVERQLLVAQKEKTGQVEARLLHLQTEHGALLQDLTDKKIVAEKQMIDAATTQLDLVMTHLNNYKSSLDYLSKQVVWFDDEVGSYLREYGAYISISGQAISWMPIPWVTKIGEGITLAVDTGVEVSETSHFIARMQRTIESLNAKHREYVASGDLEIFYNISSMLDVKFRHDLLDAKSYLDSYGDLVTNSQGALSSIKAMNEAANSWTGKAQAAVGWFDSDKESSDVALPDKNKMVVLLDELDARSSEYNVRIVDYRSQFDRDLHLVNAIVARIDVCKEHFPVATLPLSALEKM